MLAILVYTVVSGNSDGIAFGSLGMTDVVG